MKSFKKDREAADAKYTSAKRKAERKEGQKSTSVKSRLKSSFSTKDQDSKHKEKIAIMKMHQEEMLKAVSITCARPKVTNTFCLQHPSPTSCSFFPKI